MDCRHLNERTYVRIENALDASKREDRLQDSTHYKSTYGPATLINNWFENKLSQTNLQSPSKDVPVSESMDKYRKLCAYSLPDRKEYFNKLFEGLGYGQELLIDHLGFSYYGNYVSTYDLCYNHLTKGICGPFPRHYFKGQYKPSTDLCLIYGNLTQWGLKEKIYEKMKEQLNEDADLVSEHKAEFVSHDLSEVRKLNDFPSFKKIKAVY